MYCEPQGYLAYCGHAGLPESGNPADEAFCQRLGFESLEVVCAGAADVADAAALTLTTLYQSKTSKWQSCEDPWEQSKPSVSLFQ
jgi:hypothetical protein